MQYQTERTEIGEQCLVPGVQPVTMGQRLAIVAAMPLRPKRDQRPLDIGFWNPMRNQIEMF